MPEALPFEARETEGRLEIDWAPLFIAAARPTRNGVLLPATAMAFHRSLALAAGRMVDYGFSMSEKRIVALSGGVFMNRILNAQVTEVLDAMGADVRVHRDIPPNDGGIAAGQVMACATH